MIPRFPKSAANLIRRPRACKHQCRPDRGVLKNKIHPLGHHAIEANVYKDKSWFDGKECIVLDYSKTSLIAKKIRDEIREIQPGFYLGIVYWGKKRTIGFALEFPTSRT